MTTITCPRLYRTTCSEDTSKPKSNTTSAPKTSKRTFFIRRKMDPEGYLPVSLIASFNRVQALTTDIAFIVQSVENSDVVETKNGLKFRSKIDPTKWPVVVDGVVSPS